VAEKRQSRHFALQKNSKFGDGGGHRLRRIGKGTTIYFSSFLYGVSMSRYIARKAGDVHTILEGLRSDMGVKVEPRTPLPVTTVGDLRNLKELPFEITITVPQERDKHPESVVKVGKVDLGAG
jgi:hypothetical protein